MTLSFHLTFSILPGVRLSLRKDEALHLPFEVCLLRKDSATLLWA